jgi:hypothetical protein
MMVAIRGASSDSATTVALMKITALLDDGNF